jgi:membrane dipeptidase
MLPLGWSKGGQLLKNELHLDLTRADFPGYCQCFACFTTPEMEKWYQKKPVDVFEMELAMILSQIQKNNNRITLAFSAADVKRNRGNGLSSAILTIEGPAGFGYDPALLEDLYMIGFRMVTLTWNEQNPLAGSCQTGGGLTEMGREFVKEAQRVGMCIDVSHLSDEAFWDIMKITDAPIVASHSNSRSFRDVSRNLSDDMFRAICESGGVAGFNFYADFVGENPTLDTVCDHIFHLLERDPDCRHLALGGDLDGCDRLPTGIDGIQSYPCLAKRLQERGLTEKELRNLYWNNAMEVFSRCCM